MSQEVFPDSPDVYFQRIREKVFNMLGYRPPTTTPSIAECSQQGFKANKLDACLELRIERRSDYSPAEAPSPPMAIDPSLASFPRTAFQSKPGDGEPLIEEQNIGNKRVREALDRCGSTKIPKSSAAHSSVTNVSFLAMVDDFESCQED